MTKKYLVEYEYVTKGCYIVNAFNAKSVRENFENVDLGANSEYVKKMKITRILLKK